VRVHHFFTFICFLVSTCSIVQQAKILGKHLAERADPLMALAHRSSISQHLESFSAAQRLSCQPPVCQLAQAPHEFRHTRGSAQSVGWWSPGNRVPTRS
jgi:hypothetical protein